MNGEVVVFAEDECHVLWGDVIGRTWCRKNQRAEVPIENAKKRQTYYGVMNLYNKEFKRSGYERGNGENTIDFLKYLQALNRGKRLIILWDNASYHRTRLPTNHPGGMKACLAAAIPMAKAWSCRSPCHKALGPG